MGTIKQQADLVAVVEAAYALDASDEDWLGGIVDAAAPVLPRELGLCAYLFDASVRPVRVWSFTNRGTPVDLRQLVASLGDASEEFIQRNWVAGPPCATASQTPGYKTESTLHQMDRQLGIGDWLAVCAHDIDGLGCFLGAPLRRTHKLGVRERTLWSRISGHVTTSLRLRNRFLRKSGALSSASMILTPKGKVEHITKETEHARATLQRAAVAIAEARGSLRKQDPDRAVSKWRALVSAQWSLVDHFDNDGKRYLIAQANAPAAKGPESLTAREKQILALAAHGRENKMIAYELGLSDSTVRVHFARAAQKLKTKSRRATIAAYAWFIARAAH